MTDPIELDSASSGDKALDSVSLRPLGSLLQEDYSLAGVPTGLAALDKQLGGLRPGNLVVIAGRPSMGKSALAMSIAVNVARLGGGTVAVFSLEMTTQELTQRIVAGEARIDSQRLRDRSLEAVERDQVRQAAHELESLPMYLCGLPTLSVQKIRTECQRLSADDHERRLGLVVVDYLQLMGCQPQAGRAESLQERSKIGRDLKRLAMDLGVPLILLSQVDSDVEGRCEGHPDDGLKERPRLSDLTNAGSLAEDADLVIFTYRPSRFRTWPKQVEGGEVAEIIIGKHRNGPTGTVELRFAKEWMRFDDIPPPRPLTDEELAERERLDELARNSVF